MRLSKVLREFNISLDRAVEHLAANGYEIEARPTTKISDAEYQVLFDEFQTDKSKKVASKEVGEEKRKEKEELRLAREKELEEKQQGSKVIKAEAKLDGPKQVGKIDLEPKKAEEKEADEPQEEEVTTPAEKSKAEPKEEPMAEVPAETEEVVEESKAEPKEEVAKVETQYQKLDGPKITGKKIDLSQFKKPEKKKEDKNRRKR